MSFTKFYYVKEAFQSKDMEQAAKLIHSQLQKRLGVKLYQMPGVDLFVNSKNEGEGLRYILSDGRQIRFNFENKSIISVHIWKDNEADPAIEIDTKGISIVKIIPFIVDKLNNPEIGTFEVDFEKQPEVVFTSEVVQVKIGDKVYPTQKAAIADLLKTGKSTKEIIHLTNAKASSINVVKKELGLMTDVKVFEAGKNELSNDPEVKSAQKSFEEKKLADIKYVFKDLENLVSMVAKNQIKGLIVTGEAGTGKTVTTTNTLNKFGKIGDFYIHIKGMESPFGLYETMFKDNGKVLLFDDVDMILKNPISVSVLKAALDNKDERVVSWKTKATFDPKGRPEEQIDAFIADGKFPDNFIFTGRIIFITNKSQEELRSREDTASLLSRTLNIDVTLKREDIIVRIREINDKIEPQIDMEYKEMLLDFLEKNPEKVKHIDIRKYAIALGVVASGNPDWQRLVVNYL